MLSCPLACYLLPLRPKYIPQHSILEHHQQVFLMILKQWCLALLCSTLTGLSLQHILCEVGVEHLNICYTEFALSSFKCTEIWLKIVLLRVLLIFGMDKILSYLNLLSCSPLLTYTKSGVSCEA
jgi:hypothetical protein